jgi:hypothetical protein
MKRSLHFVLLGLFLMLLAGSVFGAGALHNAPESSLTKKYSDGTQLYSFQAVVATRNIDYGGTDANVNIEIAGNSYLMDKPGYNDFEKGDNDTYNFGFRNSITMGELRKCRIRIWHDNKGRNSGWYCQKVDLFVISKTNPNARLYKSWSNIGWLATDEQDNNYTCEAILQLGEDDDAKK